MAEVVQPGVLETPKKRRKVRISDIIAFAVIIIVVVWMVIFIAQKLSLKHEVDGAKIVSGKVIGDIAKADGTGVRALGNQKFQSDHPASTLNQLLNPIAQIYGKTVPTIDRQIVSNNSQRQYVIFVYRYDRLKVPFFIRIDTSKPKGSSQWYLQAFSGNADESQLLNQ